MGILVCYVMGRNLEWNWLALVSCVFLFPFTFGLYFIPESPPWLVYNDEEDLAFKSMVLIRGEEYDATVEIRYWGGGKLLLLLFLLFLLFLFLMLLFLLFLLLLLF